MGRFQEAEDQPRLEIMQLKRQLAAAEKRADISEAKQKALLIERDFWVEQGRNLQNSLQTSQRMYADLFDQLGRGVVTNESINDNLALASAHLHQPLTSVEAIRGLTASMHESTQGEYSVRNIKGLMIQDDKTSRTR